MNICGSYGYNSQGKKHNGEKKKKKKYTKVSRKQFGANGVGLCVKRRLKARLCVHVQCTGNNFHHTNHTGISLQRIAC